MLDRRAYENAELTFSLYHRSPIARKGLDFRYKISIKTHSSFNKAVFKRYKDIVKHAVY